MHPLIDLYLIFQWSTAFYQLACGHRWGAEFTRTDITDWSSLHAFSFLLLISSSLLLSLLLSFHCSFFSFCKALIEVPPSISKTSSCPWAQPWDKWVMHKLHQPRSSPRRRRDSESALGGIISSCFLSDGIKLCLFPSSSAYSLLWFLGKDWHAERSTLISLHRFPGVNQPTATITLPWNGN